LRKYSYSYLFSYFQDTLGQWRKVFYISAALSTIGNLFYLLFASATEQPWSVEISRNINEEKEINRTCMCMTVYQGMKNVSVITLLRGM
jgi:hypothetical protein